MSKRSLQALRAVLVVGAVAGIAGAASPAGNARGISYSRLSPIQKRLVSGALAMSLGPEASPAATCGTGQSGGDEPDEADNACPPSSFAPAPRRAGRAKDRNYFPTGDNGCAEKRGSNVKVNQSCETVSDADFAGRGQAQNEETIAADPRNPQNLVASQNDYRRGDTNCYAAYSHDGGRHWSDSTVPMSFARGAGTNPREYWQAGGDTSVAWDTRGNAYISCQVFNRGSDVSSDPDQSSGFVVFRSTQNGGASWNFPGRFTTSFFDPGGGAGTFEDKALMAIDDNVHGRFRDRIYVTWSEIAADGTSYVYETHSSNYGESFSPRVLVSRDSPMCTNTHGAATPQGKCNENTDADPFVGRDGALYIAYANFNNPVTGNDNHDQILLVKSTDGGSSFSAPVKVSNYYDLPDCDTYQGTGSDPFRSCVPEKRATSRSVFRATNYPSGAVNPKHQKQVVVTFGSYINKHSKESNGCAPAGFAGDDIPRYTGVKTPGACNNDILISVSNNGGASFTGTTTDPRKETTVSQTRRQATSDQWFQWEAFASNGRLAVDYYDRQYGGDESTGASDITLSGSKNLNKFASKRITSSSMPPPTQFPNAHGSGDFYGDYIWLGMAGGTALPIWSDTRDRGLFLCPGSSTGPGKPPRICTGRYPNGVKANDQNTYMARASITTK